MNYKQISLLREREFESLPRNLMNIMSMISLNPYDPAQVVGSFRFSKQEYPSDIDMSNNYEVCCTENTGLKLIVNAFKEIVKRLKDNKNVIFSDFKCGEDRRYQIDIGEFDFDQNNRFVLMRYNPVRITDAIFQLKKAKLLSLNEFNNWIRLVKENPSYHEYDKLKQAIREKLVLRWKMFEIMQGFKKLPLSTQITLEDALLQRTVTKIDVYAFIADRLIEITNFFIISLKNRNGKVEILTDLTWVIPKFLKKNLEKEIAVLSLPESTKYMKLIKRIWLRAKNENNEELLEKIQRFFNKGASKLYQVQVDVNTMQSIINKAKRPPFQIMDTILQNHKFKIASIDKKVLAHDKKLVIFNLINQINEHNINKLKLEKINEYINDLLNPVARAFIEYLKRKELIRASYI